MELFGFSERRFKILTRILAGAVLVLILKLFVTAVLRHGYYLSEAFNQQTAKAAVEGRRGRILCHDKKSEFEIEGKTKGYFPLATNIEQFDILAVPKNVKEKERAARELARILDKSETELLEVFQSGELYAPPIAKRVSKEKAEEVQNLQLAGILAIPQFIRFYPQGEVAAHLLGFVNFEGQGNYGIEQTYDYLLRGKQGETLNLRDTKGRLIRTLKGESPENGADLVLTVDNTIQFLAEEKLKEGIEKFKADSGSIIIMNPYNGKILAMANFPSYDPNTFNKVPKEEYRRFFNPAVAGTWEPGSVFKPIVMSAAIDLGRVEPDTIPEDLPEGFKNFVLVDGYEIHNSQDKSFGFETMTQVLENSDNVGMVWVADKLGNEDLFQYMQKYGFGKKTDMDLSHEVEGKLIPLKKMRRVNRATMSFGQGISVTPIQLIRAFAAIANGGKLVEPRVVEKIIYPDGRAEEAKVEEGEQIISEETAKKIQAMMVSVVERGHGKKAKVEGFKVAGKTGTAQIAAPGGGYLEEAHIGSFVGFAPAENPLFVMLVKLDRPKTVEFAESSAAPLFGDLAKWLLASYFK